VSLSIFALPAFPAAHEPERERQPTALLPGAVIPFINVPLNGNAVIVDCPLIAEEFIDQFLGFFAVWK